MLVLAPPVEMIDAATVAPPPVWFIVLVVAALIGGLGAFIDYLLDGIAAAVRLVRRLNETDRRRLVGPPAERSVAL